MRHMADRVFFSTRAANFCECPPAWGQAFDGPSFSVDTSGGQCYYSQPEVNAQAGNFRSSEGRASAFQPSTGATLAQLVEHPTCNRKVVGSIPMGGSKVFALGQHGGRDNWANDWVGGRVVKGDRL